MPDFVDITLNVIGKQFQKKIPVTKNVFPDQTDQK